jgi:hypothetical protein
VSLTTADENREAIFSRVSERLLRHLSYPALKTTIFPSAVASHNQAGLTTARAIPTIIPMDTDEAVKTIAHTLGERELAPLQQLQAVVNILGREQALALCEKAVEIEQQGGMLTKDGTCRKTVGGIFFYLVRGSGNKAVNKLWPPPRQKPPATPDSPPASQER